MKGFYEILSWLGKEAVVGIRCLTIYTWANRVVIVSSVITRIFFNPMQVLDSHISTFFNKDTRDLFMLCIMLMCQLHRVLFYNCCSIILLLFDFHSLLFIFCLTFVFYSILLLFIVHCFLFMRKLFNSDPGLYSRYFDPIIHHHISKSINIIHQTVTSLS